MHYTQRVHQVDIVKLQNCKIQRFYCITVLPIKLINCQIVKTNNSVVELENNRVIKIGLKLCFKYN